MLDRIHPRCTPKFTSTAEMRSLLTQSGSELRSQRPDSQRTRSRLPQSHINEVGLMGVAGDAKTLAVPFRRSISTDLYSGLLCSM